MLMIIFLPMSLRIPLRERPNNFSNFGVLVYLAAQLRTEMWLRLNYQCLHDFVDLFVLFNPKAIIFFVLAAVLQQPEGYLRLS